MKNLLLFPFRLIVTLLAILIYYPAWIVMEICFIPFIYIFEIPRFGNSHLFGRLEPFTRIKNIFTTDFYRTDDSRRDSDGDIFWWAYPTPIHFLLDKKIEKSCHDPLD